MKCYPVFIPTLNRFEHFRRCVESLARNTHAGETELVIGLDYPPSEKYRDGYDKIEKYIPQIVGFNKVTVFKHEKNLGAIDNWRFLEDYVFNNYDAVIATEDDNEFSPCFLDFMNKALERYFNNNCISSVQGYSNNSKESNVSSNIYFVPTGGAWGFGYWKHKQNMLHSNITFARDILHSFKKSWKIFSTSPVILRMLISMDTKGVVWGDVTYCCLNILNGWYQVRPSFSLVRNWGNDGSGLHSGVNSRYMNEEISEAKTYELDNPDICVDKKIMNNLFFSSLSANKIKAFCQIIKIVFYYIRYRYKESYRRI